jgi:hypothetical protein
MKRAFTVYYDDFTGELSKIDYSEVFTDESNLMQADVLKDAVEELDSMREENFNKFAAQIAKATK